MPVIPGRRSEESTKNRQPAEERQSLASTRLHVLRYARQHHRAVVLDPRRAGDSALGECRRQRAGSAYILRLNFHLDLHIEIGKNDGRKAQGQAGRLIVDYRKASRRKSVLRIGRGSCLDAKRILLRRLHRYTLADAGSGLFIIKCMDLCRGEQLRVVLALKGGEHR